MRLWDLRQQRVACETQVHTGAVNDIVAHRLPGDSSPLVLSSGADHRLLALDPRKSLAAAFTLEGHHDHIYSLSAIGELVVSGGGDGVVLVHNLTRGDLLYGLGANQAAVRALHADSDRLVCAGDDGTLISYDFAAGGAAAAAAARRCRRCGRAWPPPRRAAPAAAGAATPARARAAAASAAAVARRPPSLPRRLC